MRLVSLKLNNCLNAAPDAPANFGLMFNKYLVYSNHDDIEPIVKKNYQPLIDQYKKSVKEAEKILKKRHLQQSAYCQDMAKAGFQTITIHARLESPFVSGLGMNHPTETGLVLDQLSGLPYIPAASQKGVLRLAHIINSLKNTHGDWQYIEKLLASEIVKEEENGEICWQEDDESNTLFGATTSTNPLAGQLIILDAYPLTPPTLSQEVMTPHFGDYYKGTRGPTEDQSPNPIKFLAIKLGVDFQFRFLLRASFADAPIQDSLYLLTLLGRNIEQMLTTEGLGAKTALGFGRFRIQSKNEAPLVEQWTREEEERKYPWHKVIRKLNKLDVDWGQLHTALAKEDLKKFQNHSDVATVVKGLAARIRQAKPKNWKTKRDKIINDWLMPSGLAWEVIEVINDNNNAAKPTASGNTVLLAVIEQLTSFEEFKQNKEIKITKLDRTCAKALKERFSAFKCRNATRRSPEAKAWKKLTKQLKKMR